MGFDVSLLPTDVALFRRRALWTLFDVVAALEAVETSFQPLWFRNAESGTFGDAVDAGDALRFQFVHVVQQVLNRHTLTNAKCTVSCKDLQL